jgi:hypothetical protein
MKKMFLWLGVNMHRGKTGVAVQILIVLFAQQNFAVARDTHIVETLRNIATRAGVGTIDTIIISLKAKAFEKPAGEE